MKNKIIIFILSALLISGCQKSEIDTILDGNNTQLIVNLDIPAPVIARTRAGITDELSTLYVLVFDKNGLYLSRHNGELITSTATSANYKFGSLPTTREGEGLILHFVGNYDWTGFSDAANTGKNEYEVMNRLTTRGGTAAYWQRVELSDGLTGAPNTTITLKDDVSLLRNIAKITLKNLTNEPAENNYLTHVSFTLGDYIDKGTVAPYSALLSHFTKRAVTEALDANLIPVSRDESEFVSAQEGTGGNPSVAKYSYERKNSTAQNQTYIIIKAYFQNTPVPVNTTRPSYYKIDLVDSETATKLLDIERNYHYIININNVVAEGYPTLQEAIGNPASNNVNAAVQVAEYTSVSDGTNVLQIEKAVYSFVNPNQDFQVKYSYYNVQTGVVDNSRVTVTLEQNEAMKVIETFSNGNGIISARTANIPGNSDIYQATFVISALPPSNLSRRVTIRLRRPMDFLNVSATPSLTSKPTECVVADQVGQPVTITFSFPADISPAIFPLPVYVYTKKLSPDPTKEGITPLSIDPLPNGTFRYVYMAPYLGNDANDVPRTHTIYLVSSGPSSNEEVILASGQFNDAVIHLRSASIPSLGNVRFNPNPVLKFKDQGVNLTFDIPEVSDQTLPYKIRIHTDYLAYVSTATGIKCEWDEILGLYIYTTNTTGKQDISFKTTQAESSEYIRIDGDRFAATTIRRTLLMGEFKDVSVDVSGKTAGSPANITFSFDAAGAAYASAGADIYFTTQYLIPASGSGIIPTGNSNEYKMSVSSGEVKTANFILKQDLADWTKETVTLSSGELIKPYKIDYLIPGKYTFGSDISNYTDRPVLYSAYYKVAVSLKDRKIGESTQLRFTVPEGSVSSTKPLWVYLNKSGAPLIVDARVSDSQGIVSFNPEGFRLTGAEFWFKIETPGVKVITFESTVNNDTGTLTLMSVATAGGRVSDGRFETAVNIENQ